MSTLTKQSQTSPPNAKLSISPKTTQATMTQRQAVVISQFKSGMFLYANSKCFKEAEDELDAEIGEKVVIIKHVDDNWVLAKNKFNVEGIIPLSFISYLE